MIQTEKKTGKINRVRRYLPFTAAVVFGVMTAATPVYAVQTTRALEQSEETEVSVTFAGGKLELMKVPVLEFGTQTISNRKESYQAETISSEIQVGDMRGTAKGWELMVALSGFTMATNGESTLEAAEIHITNPVVSAAGQTIGAPPSTATNIVLTSDQTETTILTAADRNGMGVWDLNWSETGVELVVLPGTARAGKSAATLTWSLQSTP